MSLPTSSATSSNSAVAMYEVNLADADAVAAAAAKKAATALVMPLWTVTAHYKSPTAPADPC
jgi:hypothetical protein